jgi:UDP-N-acetyl-D-galactosamine dehydrogenase
MAFRSWCTIRSRNRKRRWGEYGLRLSPWDQLKQLDGIVLAVAHREYMQMSVSELLKPLRKQRNNVVVDVKSVLNPDSLPGSVKYWRL